MEILKSNRLILRSWKICDLDDLHEFTSNERVASMAGFKVKSTENETLNILKQFIIDSTDSLWAIEFKESHKVIGWVELHTYLQNEQTNSKEIGFVLSQKYWGLGIMAEAVITVLHYAFSEENIDSIVCSHFINNIQSKIVIEKCGFKYERKSTDKIYYSLINKVKTNGSIYV